MKLKIYRCSCRACNKEFLGASQAEANNRHKEHVKTCEKIKNIQEAFEKIERFRKAGQKILGRKVSFQEACDLLGVPIRRRRSKKQRQNDLQEKP